MTMIKLVAVGFAIGTVVISATTVEAQMRPNARPAPRGIYISDAAAAACFHRRMTAVGQLAGEAVQFVTVTCHGVRSLGQTHAGTGGSIFGSRGPTGSQTDGGSGTSITAQITLAVTPGEARCLSTRVSPQASAIEVLLPACPVRPVPGRP